MHGHSGTSGLFKVWYGITYFTVMTTFIYTYQSITYKAPYCLCTVVDHSRYELVNFKAELRFPILFEEPTYDTRHWLGEHYQTIKTRDNFQQAGMEILMRLPINPQNYYVFTYLLKVHHVGALERNTQRITG
jgi:hypothetical protein